MNPKDFEGLYKYKLLIPTFEWASVVCTFIGPVLFPTPWLLFVAAFMVLFFMTSSFQVQHVVLAKRVLSSLLIDYPCKRGFVL